MAEGTIQLPPDGTGKVTRTQTNPAVAGGAHQPVQSLAGPSGAVIGAEAFGALMVSTGFQSQVYESWSVSPIDTVDKWTVIGTAPTIADGSMTMPATVSTYNAIRGKDLIRPNNGFTHVRNIIQTEAAAATGAGRFHGLGTPATTPAAAVLAQDGVGFEVDQATGNLLAVTYAAGVRTTVATLTRPVDGAVHTYGLSFRVTRAYWFIDDMQTPVAEIGFPNVKVAELPTLIVRQNAAAFTGVPAFVNVAHLMADTARQSTVLSDPIIGGRQARVDASGALKVAQTRGASATPTGPSVTTASVVVLAANTARVGATVYVESGVPLYLHMGAVASLTAYVLQIAVGGYYEVPFGYTGILSGITAAGTAVVRVVEVI